MAGWLRQLGHSPDDINSLNAIHVAGTKGKGSTCAFTESFLRAHGERTGFPRKTGLYTSPHLIVPEERIRINSQPLHRDLFATYFFELYDRLPQLHGEYDSSKPVADRGPRYLQLYALFAFHVFIREGVDAAIFETHNGGEYDATNVVEKPVVAAITLLGMDHVDMLGPTLKNIAWHKSGIYKPGAVALSTVQDDVPQTVLRDRAAVHGEQVKFIDMDSRLPLDALPLKPDAQKRNASLAIAAAEAFLSQRAPQPAERGVLSASDIEHGVQQWSWPGRFQIIADGPCTWFLDAAHNDMSVALAAQWFAESGRELSSGALPPVQILMFSHINELRDAAALLESLARALKENNADIKHVIFTTYEESQGTTATREPIGTDLFHEVWKSIQPHTEIWNEPTVQGAIALARRLGGLSGEAQTLITGSQHLVGPALKILSKG